MYSKTKIIKILKKKNNNKIAQKMKRENSLKKFY